MNKRRLSRRCGVYGKPGLDPDDGYFPLSGLRFLILMSLILTVPEVFAQSEGPSDDELAKQAQNPIANMYSLPFQNNTTFGVGPDNRISNTLNIQPVIPIGLGEKVNLIVRTIIPIITVPDYSQSEKSRVSGLGDIAMSFFFTPKEAGKWIWGIGPVLDLPTSTNEMLGFGEFNVGPSVIALQFKGKWVYGLTANQTWSVANSNVSKFYLQYFINYNLPKAWFISWQPVITANWKAAEGEKWVVPFGANVGKIVRFGKQPVNLQAGVYYNGFKPEGAGDWQTRFQINFLFPKK